MNTLKRCPTCNGSGLDYGRTARSLGIKHEGEITEELISRVRYRTRHFGGIIRCWNCVGQGIDTAACLYELLREHTRYEEPN